jgi:hypothetical protein
MDAKLRIDLSQGILEVEGSEKFVSEVYQDFKENLSRKFQVKSVTPPPPSHQNIPTEKSTGQSRKKHKVSSGIKMPSLVKDLDLLGKDKGESLKTFISSYVAPKSAMEWNVLFVYYLQKILGIPAVGIDHIYTCYKHLNEKPPNNLYQSLIDTAHRKGSINTDSVDSITVTMVGENLVEHEMPRKDKSTGNS